MSDVVTEPKPVEEQVDDVERVAPSASATWVICEREYVQVPLSVLGKMRLAKVLARTIDEVMNAGGKRALVAVLGIDENQFDGENLKLEDLEGTVDFVQGALLLAEYGADLLPEIAIIALRIPESKRYEFLSALDTPVTEGGPTDELFYSILQTFVKQNGAVLRDFFEARVLPMLRRRGGDSAGLKL